MALLELVDDLPERTFAALNDGALVIGRQHSFAHECLAIANDSLDQVRRAQMNKAPNRIVHRPDLHVVEIHDDDIRLGADGQTTNVVSTESLRAAKRRGIEEGCR